MPHFDRYDICMAHLLLESDYNVGGWLRERPSNQRRKEATSVQLVRIGFRPPIFFSFEEMPENAQEIYKELERRYGFVE